MAGSDFGESFVESSRKNRHRRSDYYVPMPRAGGVRPSSELGEPLRHYQTHRPNSAFRYRSGRTPVFEEFRETSSSDEFEAITLNDRHHYPVGQRPRRTQPNSVFSDMDIYFLTKVQLRPDVAISMIEEAPPPEEFWNIKPVEKAAYLFYFSCYRSHFLPVDRFVRVFNREFYKLTCADMSDEDALIRICDITYKEYHAQRKRLAQARQQMEERSTLDSQISDRPSLLDDSDELSMDSSAKEPLKFRSHHTVFHFAPGGRVLHLNPRTMQNTVELKSLKTLIRDKFTLSQIELMEQFHGPLSTETKSQSVLLFIRRQLSSICGSDIYMGNPHSSDTNDCILVWRLLEMVVKQQGRVTGADLAELLCKEQIFPKRALRLQRSQSEEGSQESLRNEKVVPASALEDFTNYLLGGHVDEAIKCAENAGLLFDALVLASRMYGESNKPKFDAVMQRLLAANRSPHHPAMTLYSVAASQPVPLLTHIDADDGKGWRAHIAIVLANLKTEAAIDSIYQLGRALAAKEFNSAADFCFLATNLLSDRDCFTAPDGEQAVSRQHIELIKATLPDDHIHSQSTRFGWSILDFCATEIYEYALRLKYAGAPTPLTRSAAFQKRRLEFAQLMNEYGGYASQVSTYCTQIAQNVWDQLLHLDQEFVTELCGLANELRYVGAQSDTDTQWVDVMRDSYVKYYQNSANVPPPVQSYAPTQTASEATFAEPKDEPKLSVVEPKADEPAQPVAPVPTSRDRTSSITSTTQPAPTHNQDNSHRPAPPIHPQPSVESSPSRSASITESHPMTSDNESEAPTLDSRLHSRLDNATPSAASPYNRPVMNSTPVPPTQPAPYQPVHQPEQSVPSSPSAAPPTPQYPVAAGPVHQAQNEHQQYQHAEPGYAGQYAQYAQQSQQDHAQQQAPHGAGNFGGQQPQQRVQPTAQVPPQLAPVQQPLRPQQAVQQQLHHHPQQPQVHPQQQQMHPQQLQQQQHHKPQQQQQPAEDNDKDRQRSGKAGGFLGGFKTKLASFIPTGAQMILPDDSNPSIRWDAQLGRYVGEGVEEEVAPPPPPALPAAAQPALNATNPMFSQPAQPRVPTATAAPAGRSRLQKGSKGYYNALAASGFATTSAGAAPSPAAMLPTALPTPSAMSGFGFIPQAAADADEVSPFSDSPFQSAPEQADPTQQVQ